MMSTRVKLILVGIFAFLLGTLLAQNLPYGHAQQPDPKAETKNPKWMHGVDLNVRPGEKSRKYGIEVYRDEHNGNLIYISETGSIAVVPEKK
jgi:hypothetical protein